MSENDETEETLDLLRRVALETATARRLEADAESRLLQSVVDTAVLLFDAEAASIALFEPDLDRLEYRVASGTHGRAVVGLAVAPDVGIAGHVFRTGETVTSSDVATDQRWDQGSAVRTGYLPRCIAAVPLTDDDRILGVLQVLDKRSSPSFTERDMASLAVFAHQAAVAIQAARSGRDPAQLVRGAIVAASGGALDPGAEQLILDAVVDELDDRPSAYRHLVDQVAELTSGPRADLELVESILATVARHREA